MTFDPVVSLVTVSMEHRHVSRLLVGSLPHVHVKVAHLCVNRNVSNTQRQQQDNGSNIELMKLRELHKQ